MFRVEKDGHAGDYVHILDDAGTDRKLRITEKEIQPHPSTPLRQFSGRLATEKEGRQKITRHGEPAAVVVSAEEWKRKTRRKGNLAASGGT
jgi:prevent-host-death family protein